MADQIFPNSNIPIRRSVELLPNIFQTEANQKFIAGTLDPLVQPGTLDKTVGYIGRRYGKTYNYSDVYLDEDETLRSRYQLEPAVVVRKDNAVRGFYDYIDFKNQIKFFGNNIERDDKITEQDHYSWDPPIEWDKFVNFREYYWIPDGPPPVKILGQSQEIISSYRVKLGVGSVFIFTPDGFKNNPTLTLYRGQTYKFQVNAPDNGFVIRTAYDTGSLAYNPERSYFPGQYAIFDGKLWQAKTFISFTEGSTINEESEDWEYIEEAAQPTSFDYNQGVSNNGVVQGTLTFEVSLDAPEVLFYQSLTDPNRFGRFLIADIEENTAINITDEILGKPSYTSSNGVEFTNGLAVFFLGKVEPKKYAEDVWLVEGVGREIRLVRFKDLEIPRISDEIPEVLFDNSGFDSEPFDDASSYPGTKDYITVNRASLDLNPWSRYNRWFHVSVLRFSHEFNGTDFDSSSDSRAKRPIIEFRADLRLFNHGTTAKKAVDFIDTVTDDVFSKIEGSQGYFIDGEELFQGARVLVTADTDILANNRIYEVNYINHSTGSAYRQDWSPTVNYRTGETVRYSGQSFTAKTDNPSYAENVIQSSQTSKRMRIPKNLNLRVDQAVVFSGTLFGGVLSDKLYYVREVYNTNILYTEFTVSLAKRGVNVNLINGAPGTGFMAANFAEHPSNIDFWGVSRDRRQINLRKVSDSESEINQAVLVKRGVKNRGLMFHFDGDQWKKSQEKISVNQNPLFDVFDDNGVSFSDQQSYPVSSFSGSRIISYKQGSSRTDPELGFSLSFLNIDNVGDILFEFNWDVDTFTYEIAPDEFSKKVSTGFYQFSASNLYGNNWIKISRKFLQAIIFSTTVSSSTDTVILDPIRWKDVAESSITKIVLYINGVIYRGDYTRNYNRFQFVDILSQGDIVTVKVYCDAIPDKGYYEIPLGLEKNPLNSEVREFTLGQATDHISQSLELNDDFLGVFPGIGNLRDIDGYQSFCERFLKHSNLSPLAIQLLCDKEINLIKSLEFAAKSYRDFKNNFLQTASQLDYDQDPVNFVDTILSSINQIKNQENSFVNSDMLGTGAFSAIRYTVEDEGIKTFALSEKFSLDTLNRRAVYVYLNNVQLLVDKDYRFNSNFGFVELLVDLVEGDKIEIREYVSTVYNYVPPTPTKLGLYKKYSPKKFIDDTYVEPVEVIQGHDGSITVAFGDFRDDVLLEFETRIYNNIKVQYTTDFFDIDSVFGSYYNPSIFSKGELDSILSRQFRKWTVLSRVDSVENSFYQEGLPFTYTYSKMLGPGELTNLPGYWRGIYRWFYDTDRPHRCPWEMLGFSEKPEWWDEQYGEAPYTSNNLILWEDLRDGIIQQGNRKGQYERYKRPTLLDHIPVDGDGNLLDPIDSRLVSRIDLFSVKNNFVFGDMGPAEYAWRSSSDYPFAIMIACCLLRPFEFIAENLDKLLVKKNKIGQTVSTVTGLFLTLHDINIPNLESTPTSGLINYVNDFVKSSGKNSEFIKDKIYGIDVNLSTRLSGFVDKQQQKYILDSKNPRSTSGSVFVPPENYNIEFNISSPIKTLTYSGILVSKTEKGFRVFGYDNIEPGFNYYKTFSTASDPLISVGGVSENFIEWAPNTTFSNGTVIRYSQNFYKAIKTHQSTDAFDAKNWQKIAKLPLVGAAEAFLRVNFNKGSIKFLDYGTVFLNLQELVDFICGYEEYLKDQGFVFDEYDNDLAVTRNWTTSIKEILFWSKHNWAIGSLISLSPAANKVSIKTPIGVIDDLLDSFYEYSIYQANGNLIPIQQINVNRQFQSVSIETANRNIGIYLCKAYLVLKEHVTIFSDRTVFNDVIYEKTTGYRQDRIKSRGFRTVDWDGDYTSPGFIFDNVDISAWQPYVDYSLGDIVAYKSYYWTSLSVQRGAAEFDDSKWTKLDLIPEKQLIANFDFKANQFFDFYDLDADGVGQSQRDLARHALGYQTRDYLQELAEDQVTQFKLYQGFIREKGTLNSVEKVFNKLSKTSAGSVKINEEWAFKVGDLGGKDQVYQIEFFIDRGEFKLNPQPLVVVDGAIGETKTDQYYRINQSNFIYKTDPFQPKVNPVSKYLGQARSAGYVRLSDIDYAVKDKDELLNLDIETIFENSHFWLTFNKNSWTVLRYNSDNSVVIRDIQGPFDVQHTDPESGVTEILTVMRLSLNRSPQIEINDVIGIKDIENLTGFFKVITIINNLIDIKVEKTQKSIDFEGSTISYNLYFFTEARFRRFSDIDTGSAALLRAGSKLWIDDAYSDQDRWQVIEKIKRYSSLEVNDYLISQPRGIAAAVEYNSAIKQSFFSIRQSGYVAAAVVFRDSLLIKQLIPPAADYELYVNNSFGEAIAASPDGKWLAVSAPSASGVPSRYKGLFDPTDIYQTGDIVLSKGRLWESTATYGGDSAAFYIDIDSENWKPATVVNAVASGLNLGPINQGMVFLYHWNGGQWNAEDVLLSPRIDNDELFGSKIKLARAGSRYFLFVSAVGSINLLGRVYIFVYENNKWSLLQNQNYKGVYTGQEETYPRGSVVFFENRFWRAVDNITGDGSSRLDTESGLWEEVDPVSIETALPQRISYASDDSSFVETGLYEDSTLGGFTIAEVVKMGDQFGYSLAANADGSILAVGIPSGDDQYFENYRGDWRSYQEYRTGDVVRYHDALSGKVSYRRLFDPRSDDALDTDSAEVYVSINELPAGDPWETIGDSSANPTGKVFVYKRNANDIYTLAQTITASNLESINESGSSENIMSGDKFGFSIDLDASGYALVISCPLADINFKSQGSVFIFRTESLEKPLFKLKQKLQSFEKYPNELFGSAVSISDRAERIAVGAQNSKFKLTVNFDQASTTFDDDKTKFVEDRGNPGQVYVFEKKDQTYFLVEKLDEDLQDFESFGSVVDISSNEILVGSPNYLELVEAGSFIPGEDYVIKAPGNTDWYAIGLDILQKPIYGSQFTATGVGSGSGSAFSRLRSGKVRLFRKSNNQDSWQVTSEEQNLVDISKIKNVALIDKDKSIKINDLDVVDHYKLKIIGIAEQEISFKTIYDPAIYTQGTDQHEVDSVQSWFEKHLGDLWWDLSTAKFYYHEQGDISNRIGVCNKQVPYSSIDIYEWVESKYLPSQWANLADTVEGLALGISGVPKYADNSVLSTKVLYNTTTGEETETLYYFWVKNKTTIPTVAGRRTSARAVADLISVPESSGIPFVTLLDEDKFLLYNIESSIDSDSASINIEYSKDYKILNPVHKEYQLLTEGVADSLPNQKLETKWIDSLVGYDSIGRRIPDDTLPEEQRYGTMFRPRQSMFVDRFMVLRAVLSNINETLLSKPFADTIDFVNLNSFDLIPSSVLNEYDTEVDTALDLQNVGTTRVKRPILVANIVNGRVDTITIADPGFGYKVTPFIEIEGDGSGAEAVITIDNQGRVASAVMLNQGKNYSVANVKIRNFSVLVRNDETVKNYWSIYAWDDQRKTFIKSRIQSFVTANYWRYVDWYHEGYSSATRIDQEILSLYQEPLVNLEVGMALRVKEYGSGGWALLLRVADGTGDILDRYKLIGRSSGTIQIIDSEFLPNNRIGFDTVVTFDGDVYDLQPTKELRNILKAIKEDVFLEDLRVNWNRLFFNSLRYAFVQRPYVDWAFKTSFLTAVHEIGSLDQRPSFKSDNLESFEQYLKEVKPYRTTVREYISKYSSNNISDTFSTDFDSPPSFSVRDGKIIPVGKDFDKFDQYPWKSFIDNQGYEIVSIEVYDQGSGYTSPPSVLIEGDGTGCTATAYISNGRVAGVRVDNRGRGYTFAPRISLVGGNGTSTDIARAAATLGRGKIRSLKVNLKFDRLAKQRNYQAFRQAESFIAGGFTASFDLKYAPSIDKNTITVYKNNQLVLSDQYRITLFFKESRKSTSLSGKIVFNEVPKLGDVIEIEYDKNVEYFDALSRIEKYYSPDDGMKGKEAGQLMTGIDFGGVQIQGTTFDVTGGWDALPWFTDNWDSVESSSDFYYIADGSTTYVDLPTVPAIGENISIYLQKKMSIFPRNIDTLNDPAINPQYILNPAVTQAPPIRIDDPNYTDEWDSSVTRDSTVLVNPNAQMPTFVGDGITRRVEFVNQLTNIPYISVEAGDILIFRKDTSDGSVSINDPNIIDTKISGGSLSSISGAYITATGRTAEEIVIDGEKFISPDQVTAPEENVPGQILESVSIKVYHSQIQGSAAVQNAVYIADGETVNFDIKLRIFETTSVLVYVDKIKVDDSSNLYSIDFLFNNVVFAAAPARGSIIEIISIGLGGVNLLDYQEFRGDGETALFLTSARFSETVSVLVTVDGEVEDAIFVDSAEYTDSAGRTMVQIGFKPSAIQIVKVVCLGTTSETDSLGQPLIRVNSETIYYDGSSNRLELDRFVNLTRASSTSSILVEINGVLATGPDTIIVIYDGSNNVIEIAVDPFRNPGAISLNDFEVYINNEIQPVIIAYIFNPATNTVTVNPQFLNIDDEIKIITTLQIDYFVDQNDIVLSEEKQATMVIGDKIDITWFSEYPSFDIVSDQYTGGQYTYLLKRKPLGDGFLWVYKNGMRLSLNQDYSVDLSNRTVKINQLTLNTDSIRIVEFGNDQWDLPHAYEIHKDMLNFTHYKRFYQSGVELAEDLTYYATEIVVNDGSVLFSPDAARNIPGMVLIDNEKIEYFTKIGNVLGQLRRGSFGTPIPQVHLKGTVVIESSKTENIPYSDSQEKFSFVSDGSSLLIGPLPFVPRKAQRNSWIKTTIPESYGPCDQFEVFVGGKRLRKDPISQYSEQLGSASPAADEIAQAEFSVDGINHYVRITNLCPAGTRITIVKRTGKSWYDRGDNAAQNGKTLNDSTNAVARFILEKSTNIPR